MAFDNTVTVVGNVTRDPELRFTPGGMAVASFGVAWNRRKQEGDDEVSFFDVTCFRDLAENVAESVGKGTRVIIYGTLQQRSWETSDGDKRSKVEILADEVAPSLRWASAAVTKNDRKNDGGSRGGDTASRPVPNEPMYDSDEEPF
jgi:single-strand DNA-binding protein